MFSLKQLGVNIAGPLGFLDMYSMARSVLTHSQTSILMYHSVSSEDPPWYLSAVKPEDFEREITYLQKVAEIVPLHQLVDWLFQGRDIPSKAVCITFDDGLKDNYTFAYPILRKYNVPATIFLATGYIGHSWQSHKARFAVWNTGVEEFEVDGLGRYCLRSPDDRLIAMNKITTGLMKLPEREKNLMVETLLKVLDVGLPDGFGEGLSLSWNEVIEMNQNGISFGAHTVTHTSLTRLPIEEARKEILYSKKDIEERLGTSCTLFAYPNGEFNAEIIEILKENGFKGAVTTIPRMVRRGANLFRLGRISAGPDFYTFKGSLSGLYPDLVTALNRFKRR